MVLLHRETDLSEVETMTSNLLADKAIALKDKVMLIDDRLQLIEDQFTRNEVVLDKMIKNQSSGFSEMFHMMRGLLNSLNHLKSPTPMESFPSPDLAEQGISPLEHSENDEISEDVVMDDDSDAEICISEHELISSLERDTYSKPPSEWEPLLELSSLLCRKPATPQLDITTDTEHPIVADLLPLDMEASELTLDDSYLSIEYHHTLDPCPDSKLSSYVASKQPISHQTPEFLTEVLSSDPLLSTLHDDVEYVTGDDCAESGNVSLSSFVDSAVDLSTAGVCENAPKIVYVFAGIECHSIGSPNNICRCHDFQCVWLWFEKPPSWPPDVVRYYAPKSIQDGRLISYCIDMGHVDGKSEKLSIYLEVLWRAAFNFGSSYELRDVDIMLDWLSRQPAVHIRTNVGFYFAFLVAEKVVVSTKSPRSDKQYVWEANAGSSSYVIREETDPEKQLTGGTQITLYLNDDGKYEFSDPARIQGLVKNYSQFISFPIYTWHEELLPIWMRNPKEVEREEYNEFYKKTFNEFLDPLAYAHFTTEGEVEFRSVLFIPRRGPLKNEDVINAKTKNIRLHVKRVFISDDFDGQLFPRYLSFFKGVVDSNDLPLNVSREILQESRIVRIMRKHLVRKTFDMIEDLAEAENKKDFNKFWVNFGKFLKLGVIEDFGNHKRLAPLLRFHSSKSGDVLTSLDNYVENMSENQKAIYYLVTDSLKSVESAPLLEKLVQKDIEVLYLVESVDEIAIENLQTYKEKKFVDIRKEYLEWGDEDEVKEREEKQKYNLLCDWIKQQLGNKVAEVQVSKRLSSSPCVLVSGKFGWSANMERLMKAQALGDTSSLEFMRGRRILEINSDHPIVKDLKAACKNELESGGPFVRHNFDLEWIYP